MSPRVDLTGPGVSFWESNSIDDHTGLMRRQVKKSLADPETHKLARAVARGGNSVVAWGQQYKLTPRGAGEDRACCDIAQVWNFCVLNVAYVPDPSGYDLFCTVKRTLERHVGDCDDATILQGALLKSLGFQDVRARVISVKGDVWNHVYVMVSRHYNGGPLIALDPTVRGSTPGWEFKGARDVKDFRL